MITKKDLVTSHTLLFPPHITLLSVIASLINWCTVCIH